MAQDNILRASQNGSADEVKKMLPPRTPSSTSSGSEDDSSLSAADNHGGRHQPQNQEQSLMYSSPATKRQVKKVRIGGPGTILPFWFESLLSWIFAISCLGVALYHWIQQIFGSWMVFFVPSVLGFSTQQQQQQQRRRRPVLPLMTPSRYETIHTSGIERYQQLIQYLEVQQQQLLLQNKEPQARSSFIIEEWSDQDWIETIRNDHIVRRLVSLIRLQQDDIPTTLQQPLLGRLERIWPQLLQLPPLLAASSLSKTAPQQHDSSAVEISVVTSAFKEDGRDLVMRFERLVELASHPECVELILVNAGHNTGSAFQHQKEESSSLNHLMTNSTTLHSKLAKITIIDGMGGGRGASLNQGAALAQGRILTFLHADTRLSVGWDTAIRNAFVIPPSSSSSSSSSKNQQRPCTINTACAFSFAIDTTPQGLHGGPFPPGIKAIETTANWRTHLFHLPYGDQCLSIPKVYFDYLGGYPHQCLMEDYELVRLLRHRVAAYDDRSSISKATISCSSVAVEERLAILPQKAYCGPRRWQTFGVLYVTYTNSRCVNLYAGNGRFTPDDLYQIYYGVRPTTTTTTTAATTSSSTRNDDQHDDSERGVMEQQEERELLVERQNKKSPWELQLQELLLKYNKTAGTTCSKRY